MNIRSPFLTASVACLGILVAAGMGRASTVEIAVSGLDLSYDGQDIFANADELASVTIESEGAPVTGSPFGAGDVTIDLLIPDVLNIPLPPFGGTSNANSTEGTLTLNLPGGDSLELALGPGLIEISDVSPFQEVSYTATAATVSSQQLPDGVLIGDPISISFTAVIDAFTDDVTFFTSFSAVNGSSQFSGEFVPEPSSVGLIAFLATGFLRRRMSCS